MYSAMESNLSPHSEWLQSPSSAKRLLEARDVIYVTKKGTRVTHMFDQKFLRETPNIRLSRDIANIK